MTVYNPCSETVHDPFSVDRRLRDEAPVHQDDHIAFGDEVTFTPSAPAGGRS
ncbi:hypothetical protein [Actinomadura algeriensis]|uniref:Uncharacterized protein n=1 Tax=Actinomadura algeriensis TaxID=1679523 RepID=A0ABR9K210_9ACTN|nr:hypothetical protein [Actinomadura algeriensis]MBE1536643.1 hypothetical protein [Actinomadura algeriensis]